MVEWTEQDTRDAARLSRVLAANAEKRKAAGSLVGEPENFNDPAPTVLEKAADSENGGVLGAFDRCPPVAASREEIGSGLDGWRGSGPVETRIDFAMRPPAQPCAGSNGEGFTVEAVGERARNVRTGGEK
ncbi:MAG: hypothetical protein E5Y10_24550 [Mesorhizobium sp.]|nr:MAG: hypothetical protein E5Y10_24550 [Mesorhizobium sp.]